MVLVKIETQKTVCHRNFHGLSGCFKKEGKKNQNGWFTRENPIRIDDLEGFPIFLETPKWVKHKRGLTME